MNHTTPSTFALPTILAKITADLSFDWRYFAQVRLAHLLFVRRSNRVEKLVAAYLEIL